MVSVMGNIKDRIHQLYDKLSSKTKTAAVATLLSGATQAQAALPEQQADSVGHEVRTEVSGNVKDMASVEPVMIKDIDVGRYVFSAEVLDSVETGSIGKNLARQAQRAQRKINDETHCFRAIKLAFRLAGLGRLNGESAWEAADQLRENENFVEINCPKEDLDKLPDGAIIVYGKGKTKGTQHGHIGAVKQQKDVSSKVRNINTRGTRKGEPYGEIAVFLPADTLVKDKTMIMQMQQNNGDKKTIGWQDAIKISQNQQQNVR